MDAVLNGPNGPAQLGPTGVTLGRTPDNQIVVNDGKASSQHAEIRPFGQGYTIADLGSTNGTYVNGQRLDRNMPRMLTPGDTIRIGDTTYTYQVQNYQQPGMYAAPIPSSPNYEPTQFAPQPQQPFQATSYGGPASGGAGGGGGAGGAAYQPPQFASPESGYQPTMPAYPQYGQPNNQQYNPPYNPNNPNNPNNPSSQQGYMPPPPPRQSGASLYDQNSALTQQASYMAGSVPAGAPSSPYNGNSSYTPGYPAQGGGYIPSGLPSGPSGRKRNPLLTIALVAVALLVIIGAISTFFIAHNNQVATNNAHSTATAAARGNATGTAITQATGASQVNATATAQAQNTNPYTSGGTLAIEDTLKDNSGGHGWEEDSNCQFKENVYEINEAHSDTFFTCDAKSTNYNNIAFDVALKIIQGDCAGIAFRANPSNDAEYFFEMCQSGTYDLVMYDGTNAKYLINNTSSSAIKAGTGQINTLGVVANNSNIQLFINGTSVDQTQDSTYTGGSIGLLAINHSSSNTLVAFAGVRVWTL